VTVTGASVYAFALVLAVFLLGIGLGGRQLAQNRGSATRGQRDLDILFYCALSAPLLLLAGLWTLRAQLGESDLYSSLANRVPSGAGLARLWATHALLAALALLGPAFAFGMALPAAAAALVERHPSVPRETLLGRLYAFNTFGALCGSLGAAFLALPSLGPRASIAIALAVPALGALFVPGRRIVIWAIGVAAGVAVAFWVLAPGEPARDREVILVRHDAHTTAAVEETRAFDGSIVRTLRVNGKPEASSAPVDVRLQLLLGHIPGVLHGDVKTALVIGLGSGMTSGSLLDLATLRELTIFEISTAIEDAARAFSDWNGKVLDDPRTHLVFADGRHALARTGERFDLITADPVHPWTRGSSDLYTLEHFRSIAEHLAPNGVASQWLPVYELSSADLETVAATWCAAFEHTSAWLSAYDLVLIGSKSPLAGASRLSTFELDGRLRTSLARVAIHSGLDLAALQVADDADLRAFAKGRVPMRDDHPVLEFRAPLSYLSGYNTEVLRWAARREFVAKLPEACRPRAIAFREALERFLERLPEGAGRAAASYGEELLARRGARMETGAASGDR
jgi:spermidine synthase